MLAGEFERNLRKLNSKLRIFCGDDDSRAAGVFYIKNGEYEHICGVDKNWVGEYPVIRNNGMLERSGWRRVLRILIKEGYCTRERAEHVFNVNLKTSLFRLAAKQAKPKRDLINRYCVGGNL
jgi:hypothetical protein